MVCVHSGWHTFGPTNNLFCVCTVESPPVARLLTTCHSKTLGNRALTGLMAILRSEIIYHCSLESPSNAVAIGTSD